MADPFLIAHKVRGEPAFDVATQMECPECTGHDALYRAMYKHNCVECDGLGYWWIIPTSGHRAYPYWQQALDGLGQGSDIGFWLAPIIDEMPPSLPDHYPTRSAPAVSLAEVLGIKPRPAPSPPIHRRF